MLITRTEIILLVHSHASQLFVAVGRHFLPVYAYAHIVKFPNDRLLGTRLAPTFELWHYNAKVKLGGHVGASVKVWEQATVAKAIQIHRSLRLMSPM